MLVSPVPLGERRSSGASAPHSTYLDESHLLVSVRVTDVKEGCALGVILEHLDQAGALIAAENLSTYVVPRWHQCITTNKGSRLRIKWILTGDRPSSTFGVSTEGIDSVPRRAAERLEDEDLPLTEPIPVDVSTLQGLQEYIRHMALEAEDELTRPSTATG